MFTRGVKIAVYGSALITALTLLCCVYLISTANPLFNRIELAMYLSFLYSVAGPVFLGALVAFCS